MPDTDILLQTPLQRPEKCPQPDSYTGIATRSSSRTKKSFSPRHRGRSLQSPLQEKIDLLSLSNDLSYSTSVSRVTLDLEGIPSSPQSVILEEHSLQSDNNIALANGHLLIKSSVSPAEEILQYVLLAPEIFPTYEKVYLAFSTNKSATPETATGLPSSILNSLPDKDIQPEGLDQACPPVTCIYPVNTIKPTYSILSPNTTRYTYKVSQQNLLDIPDQTLLAISIYCQALYNSTIILPSITLQQIKHWPVSKKIKELYLDSNTIPIISGILQKYIKYYKKTADFRDRDCLVTKVLKGIGVIIKPPEDLIYYFDLAIQKRIKQELKKEQAGLESLQAINL
jgi:hypothetical protein